MDEKLVSCPPRLSWASYFCSSQEEPVDLNLDSPSGLVLCSICKQHFDNVQFMQHAILHLLFAELSLGTLMTFEFCSECLFSSTEMTMKFHNRVHRHLENHNPYALIDGNIACPTCEITFDTVLKFAVHLFERHVCCDSPYVCTICYAFHSSWYDDLLKHLHSSHRYTNHILCPYCLKHFELPIYCSLSHGNVIFDSSQFYAHVYQHWDQTTHRCESCRLEFIHRKDLKLHEYLHHSGHLLTKPLSNETVTSDVPVDSPSTDHLQLTYSNQLQTQTPRVSIRCLECGDCLRHSINRHFNMTLKCTTCAFTSSCNTTVNWHWSHVHNAPPIPSISYTSSCSTDLASDFKSWKTGNNSIPVGLIKVDAKPFATHNSRLHDPCGSLLTRMKRCKEKHSPPGLYFKGTLRCNCGFRTILCDQMARHLAVGGNQHVMATLDHGPRLSIFRIKSKCTKPLKSSLWWRRKSRNTPSALQAVGLC